MEIKILIAEDEPTLRELYRRWLCQANYAVRAVENGADASHALLTGEYALGILDIRMAPIGGLEAANYVRQKFRADDLPLIALTADAVADVATQCKEAGFNLQLLKPVFREQFLDAVYRLLEHSGHPMQQMADPGGQCTVAQLDLERLTETRRHGQVFFQDILQLFLTKAVATSAALADAIESQRLSEVDSLLHSFMPAAGTLGATAIADECERLQITITDNGSADEIRLCLARLDEAIRLYALSARTHG
jgi:two-component system, sensor histidine kinase and response regulator